MNRSLMALAFFGASTLFTGCDRAAEPAPETEAEESIEKTEPAAQTETDPPALTEAAIESLIFDALSPTGDAVATADDRQFSIDHLSEAQRKTLNEAVSKAVSKIDFKALLTSIASNLEMKGLDLKDLPGNMQVSTRVLTPEEASKMGINFQKLESKPGVPEPFNPENATVVGDVQIIAIGSSEATSLLPGNPENSDSAFTPDVRVRSISTMNVPEANDPERASRIQSLLESGDSDVLAGEIANLIQSGIDSATLQQALEGGAPSPTTN